MSPAKNNQAQVEKKLKKEITPSQKRILEFLLSLSIRHPVCYVSRRYIANRLGLSESTVQRFFKEISPFFFSRERRVVDHREISSLTHLLPEWMHIDNLRWLVKKFFPSLLKFPVFRPKLAARLLASAMPFLLPSLQAEMNQLNNPLVNIISAANSNTPHKVRYEMKRNVTGLTDEQKKVLDTIPEKSQEHAWGRLITAKQNMKITSEAAYFFKVAVEHSQKQAAASKPVVAAHSQNVPIQKPTKFSQDDIAHIQKTINGYEKIIRIKHDKIRNGQSDRYDEVELKQAELQLQKWTDSLNRLCSPNPFGEGII